MVTQYKNNNSLVVIPDYETFTRTVDALAKLYPTLTKANCIANGTSIFTDIVMTKDVNGNTLNDIYGKAVATDLVSALIRHTAYGYYLSRPVLVVPAAAVECPK